MRTTRQIRSGCGSSRIRHGSPGSVPVARASSTIRARCWNATAMPRSPRTWTCSPGGPATRSWRAASERTASASTSSDGRASRKSTIASTAVSSAMV